MKPKVFAFISLCSTFAICFGAGNNEEELNAETKAIGEEISIIYGFDDEDGPEDLPEGVQCRSKVVIVEDFKSEEEIQCHHVSQESCFQTMRTTFETSTIEECKDKFVKDCYLEYVPVPKSKELEICRTPYIRDCDQEGEEVCTTEYESVCETVYDGFNVDEDAPDCDRVNEQRCEPDEDGETDCYEVERIQCEIDQVGTVKIVQETKCRKVPRTVCGPELCPLVKGQKECSEEIKTFVEEVPEESCDLVARKVCNPAQKIVPVMRPTTKCVDVPKEICSSIKKAPQKIKKPVVKKWCKEDHNYLRNKNAYLMVIGGIDGADKALDEVETIPLMKSQEIKECARPPPFPFAVSGAIGANIQGVPTVCGGFNEDQSIVEAECRQFIRKENDWIVAGNMNEARSFSGFAYHREWGLVAVGGKNGEGSDLDSVEISRNGVDFELILNIPRAAHSQCVVIVDKDRLFVFGGSALNAQGQEEALSTAFMYSKILGSWSQLADMSIARSSPICGKIDKNGKRLLFVAGGSGAVDSELYDLENANWMSREEGEEMELGDLPTSVVGGVSNIRLPRKKGSLLIGGTSFDEENDQIVAVDSIIMSRRNGDYTFLDINLSQPKSWSVAMVVSPKHLHRCEPEEEQNEDEIGTNEGDEEQDNEEAAEEQDQDNDDDDDNGNEEDDEATTSNRKNPLHQVSRPASNKKRPYGRR